MKSMKHLTLIAILPACMLYAGEQKQAEHEELMKQAINKESKRAEEAVQHHSNAERFEQKYGWAKEKHPELFAAMMTANKKAGDAWAAVASQSKSATHPEALSDLKQAANSAAAKAYQAEIALKYAAASAERNHMAEKSGSAEVGAITSQLDANEKALLQAQKTKDDAAAALEKLQNENRALNKTLHETYKKARESKPMDEQPKKQEGERAKKQ